MFYDRLSDPPDDAGSNRDNQWLASSLWLLDGEYILEIGCY
jgi:hypothetical protein